MSRDPHSSSISPLWPIPVQLVRDDLLLNAVLCMILNARMLHYALCAYPIDAQPSLTALLRGAGLGWHGRSRLGLLGDKQR